MGLLAERSVRRARVKWSQGAVTLLEVKVMKVEREWFAFLGKMRKHLEEFGFERVSIFGPDGQDRLVALSATRIGFLDREVTLAIFRFAEVKEVGTRLGIEAVGVELRRVKNLAASCEASGPPN